MNRAEFLFTLIDIFGKPLQNTVKLDGIVKVQDVAYGELPVQKVDLYYKNDGVTDKPVFFYFHGGGFIKGGKKYRRSISEIIADSGYFVVNVDYRLAPKYPFPACIEDGINALNFAKKLNEVYPLDLNKIVVGGDSSGGYTAAYMTALFNSQKLQERLNMPKLDVNIAAFVGLCGVYDVVKMIKMKEPFGIAKKTGESFFGIKAGRKWKNLNSYQYADCISPVDFIDENWIKTLIIFSKHDILCPRQGETVIERLKENNVELSSYGSKKFFDNHCFHFHFWRKAAKEATAKLNEFLEEVKRD